uniref:Ankyrin repeat domain-containing protein 45-like n=1 Tax=Phallusia mammillata TaxID=59560 RepID=A0A6F9D694_9ASCI|nr:ankyrin repeat domain-containing protein 45-like [Phallusia mammillata]
MTAGDVEAVEENEQTAQEEFDGENVIMHCTLHDDLERLNSVFTNPDDANHDNAAELLTQRVKLGKTPLELASMLGRVDILKDLIKRGADPNQASPSGYTPMHFAASWGQVSCLEALFEAGASIEARSCHGENPKQIAVRYEKKPSIEFLDWAAAKMTLVQFIAHIREMIADPEKLQGVKLSKEEKSTAIGSCNEKEEWISETPDATAEEFMMKKLDLEKQVEFLTEKVNSPGVLTQDAPEDESRSGFYVCCGSGALNISADRYSTSLKTNP